MRGGVNRQQGKASGGCGARIKTHGNVSKRPELAARAIGGPRRLAKGYSCFARNQSKADWLTT